MIIHLSKDNGISTIRVDHTPGRDVFMYMTSPTNIRSPRRVTFTLEEAKELSNALQHAVMGATIGT